MRLFAVLAAIALGPMSAGCGGDDDGTALAGIYQLSSWTHNPDGCDQEGPAAAEESFYSHFFVRQDSFFGVEFVSAVMCADLEECRTNAADTDTLFIGNFAFDGGDDDGGWTGNSSILQVGETCMGQVFESTLTGDAGSAARIERQTKSVSEVPLDEMQECDTEGAYQQAASLPCEELSVVTGGYLEAI